MPSFFPGTWRVVRLPESSARSNDPEFEKEYRSYLMSWKNSSENFRAIQKSSRLLKAESATKYYKSWPRNCSLDCALAKTTERSNWRRNLPDFRSSYTP